MTRRLLLATIAAAVLFSPAWGATDQPFVRTYLVDHYSPTRDPERDLAAALQMAQAQGKNVLLVGGGDWCVWCEILDRFIAAHADVRAAMTDSFVIVKVNTSRENENEAFLSRYPTPRGYPDLIVIGPSGAYLGSQDSEELEQGLSYNSSRTIAFARRWRR